MAVPTSPTWQEVLQRIIVTPSERKRLAMALGINEMTLNRWAKANSRPQRAHLVSLDEFCPEIKWDHLYQANQVSSLRPGVCFRPTIEGHLIDSKCHSQTFAL